jgi:glycerol-3-phosphate dehydrogenase subunit B
VTFDVVVIGAGLAGMSAALRVAEGGLRVCVVAKGPGSMNLSPVTIDVLGATPAPVTNPGEALRELIDARPDHPYARVGPGAMAGAVSWLKDRMGSYPYTGDLSANYLLPTAIGAVKPSAVVPRTMAAGDVRQGGRFVVIGFRALKDFYPSYLADNLEGSGLGVRARAVVIDSPLDGEADVSPLGFARRFEDAEFRKAVISRLEARLEPGERVAFPAVLGLGEASHIHEELQDLLGTPVFEIPTLPPSVPGIRVSQVLKAAILRAGGRVTFGAPVVGAEAAHDRVEAVLTESAARPIPMRARWFVLATGGFASGGLAMDSHGFVREAIFGLPVSGVPSVEEGRFLPEYLADHPISRAGIAVDAGLRPLDADGTRVHENVLVAGATLAGAEPWKEGSGDGISLGTGYRAAQFILEEAS